MMQGSGAKQMMQMMKNRAVCHVCNINFMQVLDGKQTSLDIQQDCSRIQVLVEEGKKKPHLAFLVGNNGASETYVGAKVKACERVGFDSTLLRFDESITEDELVAEVNKINKDANINGLIVQVPPSHGNEMTITETILPSKDVDGFTHIIWKNGSKFTYISSCYTCWYSRIDKAIQYRC